MDLSEIKQFIAAMSDMIEKQSPALDPFALTFVINPLMALVGTLFESLTQCNEALQKKQEDYDSIVTELKEAKSQLNRNSDNSSVPSSKNPLNATTNRNRSLRRTTNNSQGAQLKHKGSNMTLPHEPNVVIPCWPDPCKNCGNFPYCQQAGNFKCRAKRFQVEAEICTKVIEFQALDPDHCPLHNKGLKGEFPPDITAYMQYGNSVAALATLLNVHCAVGVDKVTKLLSALLNIPNLSPGTIVNMVKHSSRLLAPAVQVIKDKLQSQPIIHFDETGFRVAGSTFWVHNASNALYTYLTLSDKRGSVGIEQNGVIVPFIGIAVHDCWAPYWKFGVDGSITHAVCCAHILRELQGIKENEPEHTWALRMSILLRAALKVKKKLMGQGHKAPSELLLKSFLDQYDKIIHIANTECPSPPKEAKPKKGRQKKGKERALIERLEKFKDSVCLFFKNFAVPFDNNQAERDIRNIKVKAKVSGCLRSQEGAQDYLTITSYLSTAVKLGHSVYEALTQAYKGNAEFIFSGRGA